MHTTSVKYIQTSGFTLLCYAYMEITSTSIVVKALLYATHSLYALTSIYSLNDIATNL